MSVKELLAEKSVSSLPSLAYFSAWLASYTIQDIVAVLTGIYVSGQIYKLVLELKDRRAAKLKEAVNVSQIPID